MTRVPLYWMLNAQPQTPFSATYALMGSLLQRFSFAMSTMLSLSIEALEGHCRRKGFPGSAGLCPSFPPYLSPSSSAAVTTTTVDRHCGILGQMLRLRLCYMSPTRRAAGPWVPDLISLVGWPTHASLFKTGPVLTLKIPQRLQTHGNWDTDLPYKPCSSNMN